MATIVLVRHGRTSANERGILAGRSPGVTLDEVGQEQATALAR
ncbi:MAG: histidine phosphatase family protein, partial [Actinomycetota bacterium]|nr:histidine phosphatase family protein [Actinomycetota bacterium]